MISINISDHSILDLVTVDIHHATRTREGLLTFLKTKEELRELYEALGRAQKEVGDILVSRATVETLPTNGGW